MLWCGGVMVGVDTDTGHPPPGLSFYRDTWSVMSPLCLPSVSRPQVSLLGHFLLEHLVTTAPWESKWNINIFVFGFFKLSWSAEVLILLKVTIPFNCKWNWSWQSWHASATMNDCWFLISCSRPNIVNNELLKPHVVPLSTISGLILYLAGGLETSSTDLKFPLKVLVNPLNP